MRIGNGYDVHRLTVGRPLIIGGVRIPHRLGLLGHSDADVLVHAVIDSLLGAAGLRDIGTHFPDTDPKYKDADSLRLLSETAKMISDAGFHVVNVDSVIVAEEPKLAPYIEQMVSNLAGALQTDRKNISVKAKTEEKMGFTGSCEGMKSYAVCLIESTK